ncbi:MAG: glycosyltransferase [Micrococcales bacterium]|nr:glycosyltransferase [Micrococcales bacterium]
MRVLMLVWTGVATDTRVLREAGALVGAGHTVHVVGRGVPADWTPPDGVTVDSAGRPPAAQTRGRELTAPERLARWALLPTHVRRRLGRWQAEAEELGRRAAAAAPFDVVHAHDFTALPVGARLAGEWDVPLVYDTHEYWVGRPVEGRPAPLLRRREAALEDALGRRAAAVVTVGEGVAEALRGDHPHWPVVTVVHNTFPARTELPPPTSPPRAFVYAGRLAADRELEVISAASRDLPGEVVLRGPADAEWLGRFDPGAARVEPAAPLEVVDHELLSAGVALVTHSDRWPNHRLAMPNKLFHAVSLGVPVLATDVGELGKAVRRYGLGTTYRPGDAEDLVRAGRELVATHAAVAARVAAARSELSWDADAGRLAGVYARLGGPAGPLH